jgi:hypothetical protein
MVFICPMCREEYLLYSKLCPSCDKVRHFMSIYGREKVIMILNNNLVVGGQKKNPETETHSNMTMSIKQPIQKKN